MSQLKIVSGLPYKIVIESWNTHASSSPQETLLWKAAARGLKEKRERSQSVPLTLPASYSLFLRRIGSMDWTELGRQRYRQGSTAPAAVPTSAHSRQQFTNVESISSCTAVLPLTEIPQPPFEWKYYKSREPAPHCNSPQRTQAATHSSSRDTRMFALVSCNTLQHTLTAKRLQRTATHRNIP